MNALTRVRIKPAWRGSALASVAASVVLMMTGSADAQRPAAPPDAQLYASPSQVRLVQEKLIAEGRKPGTAGTWDSATVAEVRDFQKANGLAPTGQLDTSLLSALKIGDVLEGETSSGRFLDGLLQVNGRDDAKRAASGSAQRGTPIFVSPMHVAQIQYLLREQGHYDGGIDGVWGPGTAAAANKFRRQQGLEANDGIDIALLQTLNQRRADFPQPTANVLDRTEGMPLHAGPEALRALQRELAQRGHEAGDIDGVWGERTRQALRDFQRQRELEATGTLTLPTLAALGIDITNQRQAAFDATKRTGAATAEQDPVATAESQRD